MNEFYLDILNVLLTERGFKYLPNLQEDGSKMNDYSPTQFFRNEEKKIWFICLRQGGYTIHTENLVKERNYNNHFEDLTSALEFLDKL
jgi:hypothetical protein